jgi:hypothetical protein
MDNVLNTVNHTTVEALGFQYKGERYSIEYSMDWHPFDTSKNTEPTFSENTFDVYERNGLVIHLSDNGKVSGIYKGQSVELSLDFLKSHVKGI